MDWEQCYIDDDIPWDLDAPTPELAEMLKGDHPFIGNIAVPGAGRGHDAAAIASSGARHVTALDLSPSAIEAGNARYALPNLDFQLADIFQMPAKSEGNFDLIWEYTCYCAIDPSQRNLYTESMSRLLKPGGTLLGIFFLTPWDTPEENATKGPPFGATEEGIIDSFAPHFEVTESRSLTTAPIRREGRERFLSFRKKSSS